MIATWSRVVWLVVEAELHVGTWGPDPVESILRHRGQFVVGHGENRDLLLPLDRQPVISGDEFDRFLELFGKRSFRQVARRILAIKDRPIRLSELESFAGADARGYLEFLVALGVGELAGANFTLRRSVDNIGATLEWYIGELCRRELAGSSAWGVKLEGLPSGGDYDVLAWLPPALVWVEAKSAAPTQVTDSELRNFLQRGEELAPEIAVLMVDTSDGVDGLVARLNTLVLPILRKSIGISDETWQPDEPFIASQPDYPGIYWGNRNVYVTGTKPSMLRQLRRVLQHYHARVKGASFWGGLPINWITGEVGGT